MSAPNKVKGTVIIEISGEFQYSAREMLDWIEERLRQPIADKDWGCGRGRINYASGKVLSVALAEQAA